MPTKFIANCLSGDIERLLRIAAVLSSQRVESVEAIARGVLMSRGGQPRSFLNNDGSPLQICVSVVSQSSVVRLIGDPGADSEDPVKRLHIGREAVSRMLQQSGAEMMRPLCETTIHTVLPTSDEDISALRHGSLWIGVGLNRPGFALYTNPAWGSVSQQWDRADRWLGKLLEYPDHARATLRQIYSVGQLASLAIEGTCPADARLKVYWRLRKVQPIREVGIALLEDPAFGRFLGRAIGDAETPSSGLVFSTGFSVSTGAIEDAKVDLCAHCIRRSPQEWLRIVRDCGDSAVRADIDEEFLGRHCELALLGLGLDRHGNQRLNSYLKVSLGRSN
jgi:hypothetical protein